MRREYIFIILILIMLYIMYLIIWYKFKEYKTNWRIENLNVEIQEKKQEIINKKNNLSYLSTNAYIDYMGKSISSLQNKWEIVIYLNKESNNNYKKTEQKTIKINNIEMYFESNIDKWKYFLFKI